MNDPWYDYLAFPLAPLLLLVQIGTLFIRTALWRWGINIGCVVAITTMLFYVDSIPVAPDEGVNIGAGVLLLWVLVSFGLLGIVLVRDLIGLVIRSGRAERSQERGARG